MALGIPVWEGRVHINQSKYPNIKFRIPVWEGRADDARAFPHPIIRESRHGKGENAKVAAREDMLKSHENKRFLTIWNQLISQP